MTLYVTLDLDLDIPMRMIARGFLDVACTEQVEEIWRAYRPHCGGLGCLSDYQNDFKQHAIDFLAHHRQAIAIVKDTL